MTGFISRALMLAATAALSVVSLPAQESGNAQAGKDIFLKYTCYGCHGFSGQNGRKPGS